MAQYACPLAARHYAMITMSLREAFHFIELRSRPQGHPSYRALAKSMHDQLRAWSPELAKHIRCDQSLIMPW